MIYHASFKQSSRNSTTSMGLFSEATKNGIRSKFHRTHPISELSIANRDRIDPLCEYQTLSTISIFSKLSSIPAKPIKYAELDGHYRTFSDFIIQSRPNPRSLIIKNQ